MHAGLLEVHVQAGDLCVLDTGLHGLAGDGAVEGIAAHKDRLTLRLAVGLQDIDGLDGVFGVTTQVGGLDGQDGLDSQVGKEIRVAAVKGSIHEKTRVLCCLRTSQ